MGTLESLRAEIRQTDEAMRTLFLRRCDLVKQIGIYKKTRHLPILDAAREAENRRVLAEKVDESLRDQYMEFLQMVMDLAKQVERDG